MFKKKFDRVNGETRVCRVCGDEFHAMKPIWSCAPCLNKQQKKYNQTYYTPKDMYPFSNKTSEANNRFAKIRAKLNQAWKKGPEEVKAHYERQLKEIEQNGILDWIYDRRDNHSLKEKKIKTRNRTRKEFPDTTGHNEY
jgi:rubrerythrin